MNTVLLMGLSADGHELLHIETMWIVCKGLEDSLNWGVSSFRTVLPTWGPESGPRYRRKKKSGYCGTCLYLQSWGNRDQMVGVRHNERLSGLAASEVDSSWGMMPCVHMYLLVSVHPHECTHRVPPHSFLWRIYPEMELLCHLLAPSWFFLLLYFMFPGLCSVLDVVFLWWNFWCHLGSRSFNIFPFLFIWKILRAFTVPLSYSLASLH